ncbi:hypothetical protein ONE63_001865 [Megalurothrips usitatus]|uniref:Shugoshin C-terminal domain-containing protein n=1 Tax=Megalurothrips usitatus TaxID=439358 RepID=A0AAV7XGK1_9NEOP|nr:hypothetical protein ONE63_001865 [Megalurothrips usitatus]
MKPSGKRQKCRVLVNTIKKKSERSFNSSGNKSFLNKSINPYITDLRNNNARLAHSLAIEKSKIAKLFARYTECQAQVLSAKAVLRNVSTSIKDGLSKFRNGLDLMIEAAELLCGVTDKVGRLCPELENPAVVGDIESTNGVIAAPQPRTPDVCVSALSPERGPTAGVVRHCTARPMVKGQVISNPTISLQRVSVPSRVLGKGTVKPTRGDQGFNRLSNVPEAINESHESSFESSPSSARVCYPAPMTEQSQSPISMPPSHVLLERITTGTLVSDTDLSPNALDEDQQLTVVHFGRMNFSCDSQPFTPDLEASLSPTSGSRKSLVNSPRKTKDSSTQNVPGTSQDSPGSAKRNSKSSPNSSQIAFNSSNSDEYLTESSSEDEELALQLAESKKSYLQRVRQEDSREGTSWNYDDTGKFRVRPPKKKKMKLSDFKKICASQSTAGSLKTLGDDLKHPKGRPVKQTLKQKEIQEPPGVEPVLTSEAPELNASALLNSTADSNSRLSLPDDLYERTILDEQDMSLTECNPSFNPSVLSEVAKLNSQCLLESQTSKNGGQNEEHMVNELSPVRAAYVTQRSRGRKPGLATKDSGLSPLSTSNQRCCSKPVNNENSPPKNLLQRTEADIPEKRTASLNYEDLSPKPSFVVLERLPNNIIYRNVSTGPSMDRESPVAVKRKTNPLEDGVHKLGIGKEVTRSRSSGRKHSSSLQGKNTQPDKIEQEPSSEAPHVKCKPGPKQSKIKKNKVKVEKDMNDQSHGSTSSISLSPQVSVLTVSAPTSPTGSVDSSEGYSIDHHHRPRRNAAPSNFKEPSLIKKLRRK